MQRIYSRFETRSWMIRLSDFWSLIKNNFRTIQLTYLDTTFTCTLPVFEAISILFKKFYRLRKFRHLFKDRTEEMLSLQQLRVNNLMQFSCYWTRNLCHLIKFQASSRCNKKTNLVIAPYTLRFSVATSL